MLLHRTHPQLWAEVSLTRSAYLNDMIVTSCPPSYRSSPSLQTVCAVGMFELQIHHFQNPHGFLQNGDCCDLQSSGGQRCSARDQCDTFFQACLKEYQARVVPTGTCTFGSGSTRILGGNSQSLHHRGHDGGGGGEGDDGTNGHIVIPFKYAWPVSTGAVVVIGIVAKATG